MKTLEETTPATSRRTILKSAATAGAVLLIGFDVPQVVKGDPTKKAANPLRSWVQIDESGTVTILFAHSEMGQGISSALPLALADELGVDWNAVRIEQAPNDPAVFGNQGTGGSGSVAGSFPGPAGRSRGTANVTCGGSSEVERVASPVLRESRRSVSWRQTAQLC